VLVSLFAGRALKLPQCWNRDAYQAEEEPIKVTADGGLAAWAEASGRRRASGHARGELQFAFYGRASTED
jgi:hypothetical protein